MGKDREIELDLGEEGQGAQLLYRSSSAHPTEYAIVLRVWRNEAWEAVFSVDNSHDDRIGVDVHHAHRYAQGVKGPPEPLPFPVESTNDAMHKVIHWMADNWEELVHEHDANP